MYAIRQLQNIGGWVSNDAQSAQVISFDDEETVGINEFLVLRWLDWYGVEYEVVYIINTDGEMYRYEYQDDIATDSTFIADSIDREVSRCALNDPDDLDDDDPLRYLTVKITAEVGVFRRVIETRIYEIVPRYVL
jgi:hypothetical protein